MNKEKKQQIRNIALVYVTILLITAILIGLFYKPEFDPIEHYEKSVSDMNSTSLERISKCNKYKPIDCAPSYIGSLKNNIEYSYNVNSSLSLISSVERAQ
ncbi:TPA: hypothetical protein ACKTGI_002744 [Pseudomonas aeruginosa]